MTSTPPAKRRKHELKEEGRQQEKLVGLEEEFWKEQEAFARQKRKSFKRNRLSKGRFWERNRPVSRESFKLNTRNFPFRRKSFERKRPAIKNILERNRPIGRESFERNNLPLRGNSSERNRPVRGNIGILWAWRTWSILKKQIPDISPVTCQCPTKTRKEVPTSFSGQMFIAPEHLHLDDFPLNFHYTVIYDWPTPTPWFKPTLWQLSRQGLTSLHKHVTIQLYLCRLIHDAMNCWGHESTGISRNNCITYDLTCLLSVTLSWESHYC